MYQSVDEYYQDVMAHGTPQAKVLMTEEACMAGNLAGRLLSMQFPTGDEAAAKNIQREIMALLHCHRAMVLANYFMERAAGYPLGTEGPVVTAQPLMEERPPDDH